MLNSVESVVLNCFSLGRDVPNSDSKWASSASQQLTNECYEIFRDLATENCRHDNDTSNNYLNPSSILHQFSRMLCTVLKKSVSNRDCPIVWKTIPSRRNAYLGHYALVIVENTTYPMITEEYDEDINDHVKKKRKLTFNHLFKLDLGPCTRGKYYKMNIDIFLTHVLIYKYYGSLCDENYKIDRFRTIMKKMKEFKTLEISAWYRDLELPKRAKNSLKSKNGSKKELIAQLCASFNLSSNITEQEINTIYMEGHDPYDQIRDILGKEINTELVHFIKNAEFHNHA